MIELKKVNFTYKGTGASGGLKDVDLSIRRGETVLLCGESGCGKTTLTRLINGLIPNYYEGELSGEVRIDGRAVDRLPLYETAELVGSVFQNPRSQFFNVDTTSELAFGCENKGLPPEEIERRIAKTVSEMKIQSLMGRNIFKLSGGEKQKIACASVAAAYPEIFVLDEPSSNLDADATWELRGLLTAWKKKGKTVVIAEHRLFFLHGIADRVIYLKDGRIRDEFMWEQLRQMDAAALAEMGLRLCDLNRSAKKADGTCPDRKLLLKDFAFSYGKGAHALQIGSLSVPKDGIIAVIGCNGAGKSTFARCLCGLEKRGRGTVDWGGAAYGRKDRLKRCYMVMQDVNHQLFTESVLDEVLLSMEEECGTKAEHILKSLDLHDFTEFHPMALSGGQKQRLAIASAVASERDIIVFDEPTSGLDLRHMGKVAELLRRLRDMGKTQFIITHDLELILECCTHIVHLHGGEVRDEYPLDSAGEKKLADFFITRFERNNQVL
jgi:energy-coupling factor transport system ATP-binding protein